MRRDRVFKPMPQARMFAVFSLAAALAFPQAQPAQQPSPEESQLVIRTGVNVVIAPTIVTDGDGSYVAGIQPSEFRLTDNGKPQAAKVDQAYNPISLVIAIQANAQAEPALGKIKKIGPILKPLIVGDAGEVAILAFDHRVQTLQDFTSDGDKLDAALEQLKPGSGQSCMNDAVVQASRMLSRRPPDRRRILLLISETRDIGSASKKRDALTDLQFANVVVYSVNMSRLVNTLAAKPPAPRPDPYPPGARPGIPGSPNAPTYTNQTYGNATNSANFIPMFVEIFKATKDIFVDNPIEMYTKWTGGRESSFLNQRDLERAISGIGEELHSGYLLAYTPSNREEGGFHEISVEIPSRPGLKIRTRPGYWVAAQATP